MLSIPGLTHPVRDLYLEDVLERTNFIIGRGSKYVLVSLLLTSLSTSYDVSHVPVVLSAAAQVGSPKMCLTGCLRHVLRLLRRKCKATFGELTQRVVQVGTQKHSWQQQGAL